MTCVNFTRYGGRSNLAHKTNSSLLHNLHNKGRDPYNQIKKNSNNDLKKYLLLGRSYESTKFKINQSPFFRIPKL